MYKTVKLYLKIFYIIIENYSIKNKLVKFYLFKKFFLTNINLIIQFKVFYFYFIEANIDF